MNYVSAMEPMIAWFCNWAVPCQEPWRLTILILSVTLEDSGYAINNQLHIVDMWLSALQSYRPASPPCTGSAVLLPATSVTHLHVFVPPPTFIVTTFDKYKSRGNEWFSPPFYSHIGGYKMCLGVYANGYGECIGTHVTVAVYLMRGEYDDDLCWPFSGAIAIQLVNRREEVGHVEETVDFADSSSDGDASRVMEGQQAPTGRGYDFISHSALLYNESWNTEYLKNDSLEFRVTRVEVEPAERLQVSTESGEEATPTKTEHKTDEMEAESKATHIISDLQQLLNKSDEPRLQPVPPVTIIMSGFISHKMQDTIWFSPPFYSHIGGYKMCLIVNANGRLDGAGTHVSVFVNLMRGEYDGNLHWPFRGDVAFRLVNHRADEGHVEETVCFDDKVPDRIAGRVMEGEQAHFGTGFEQLISHSALSYGGNTGFLEKDSLEFQVISAKAHSVGFGSGTVPGDFRPLFGEEEDLRRALRLSLQDKDMTAYMHST